MLKKPTFLPSIYESVVLARIFCAQLQTDGSVLPIRKSFQGMPC